jgi:hypothetical protein
MISRLAPVSSLTPSRRHLSVLFAAVLLTIGFAACGNSESNGSTSGESNVTATTTPGKNSSFTVKKGVVRGYVDSAKVEGNAVLLTGWAASHDLSQTADQAVAQVGGETVVEAVPAVERADVAAYYGKPALKHSGFLLRIPLSALECSAPAGGVQVFGVLHGSGGRLALVEGSSGTLSNAC